MVDGSDGVISCWRVILPEPGLRPGWDGSDGVVGSWRVVLF